MAGITRTPGLTVLVLVLVLLVSWSAGGHASVPATGTFAATEACPAYVSKNRKTNPGDVRLQPGKTYAVFEVNRPQGYDWLRLRITSAQPAGRWVHQSCGQADLDLSGPGNGGSPQPTVDCRAAGLADSHVLALSWQSAFCESQLRQLGMDKLLRTKPECTVDDPSVYYADNFTLHGLWPNRKECGTNYGKCGEFTAPPASAEIKFCGYPELPLEAPLRTALSRVMPSAGAGSCLQRHEWYKHGTCTPGWSPDFYFHVAVALAKEFNELGMAEFVSARAGERITARAFCDRMDQVFGVGAHKRLQLSVSNGVLGEVRIRLPAHIEAGDTLTKLIREAAPEPAFQCNGSFTVDPFGYAGR